MADGPRHRETVLVVIPVRNRPRLILKTLDSVLAQTHSPDELVVVDDGSTDDDATPLSVEAWIRDCAPPFPARVLRCVHRCQAAARNSGLAEGRPTHWVGFLDSDDLWPPDFLERCLAASERSPGAVGVSADQRLINHSTGEVREQDASTMPAAPANWLLRNEPCLLSCSLLRSDLVRAQGGLDEQLLTGEDLQLVFPVTLEGPWLHAPGDPVVYQRGTPGGEDSNVSRRFDDRHLRWARIYDALLARPDLRATVDPGLRVERLWYFWWEAAEHLRAGRSFREARGCYARAIRYRPFHRKTWSRWAKCLVTRGGRRQSDA